MILLKNLNTYIKQIPGFHTSRKIVVIESDDWGSIRMPSSSVLMALRKEGFNINSGVSARYNKYDSLATYEDLSELFEVLTSVRDSNGNYCVLTPMSLVANPDFDKIEKNNFQEYYYEPFTDTLDKYPGCEHSIELWKEGIRSGIFIPQFHGREHLNISNWMETLRIGDKDALFAFKHKFWGYPKRPNSYRSERSFQAAFDFYDPSELDILDSIISEGLTLFKHLLGYTATCFTPPNGPLSIKNEKILSDCGIKFIQTSRLIYEEPVGLGKIKKRIRFLGRKNQYNQLYFVRNSFFEPNEDINYDWVGKCLNEINIAFDCKKPAIISSHRVNYIGSINPENRHYGLGQLKLLLKKIVKNYPEVEFMTSPDLGRIISGDD